MSLATFDYLPGDAQVWVYGFAKPLDGEARRIVDERLTSFLEQWQAHQAPVKGAYVILDDRFVVLSGMCADPISGCSIDSVFTNFKHLRDEHGLDSLDRSLVFYRDNDGTVQSVDRPAFQALLADGNVTPDTPVFDTTVRTLAELRERFEPRFADAWHAKLFTLGPVTGSTS